jgi:hypothetical protein
MSKTYLVGKIGKSVKFNQNTWSGIGGDNEAPVLIRKIANLNPEDTFIILGHNDVDKQRSKMNIPHNIISIYNGSTSQDRKDVNYIVKKLDNVKIDGCFLFGGPAGTVNIPNKSYSRRKLKHGEKSFVSVLEMFKLYVGPVFNYLNESNIPWLMILNDPRYAGVRCSDLMNKPKLILSQYDETIGLWTYNNWEEQNQIECKINARYSGVEKIFLIDKKIPDNVNKTTNFMIVLNEGNNGVKSRYQMLKEYVLDNIDDVEIYGKWDKETIGDDPRFKGSKKFVDLHNELSSVKYTLVIPIKPGWVTSKWIEMIANKVIPFFHPTYDEQRHCNVPEYIRLKHPGELMQKIQELNSSPDLYNKVLSECLACITNEDLDGTRLSNFVLEQTPQVHKDGKEFTLTGTTITNAQKNICIDEW